MLCRALWGIIWSTALFLALAHPAAGFGRESAIGQIDQITGTVKVTRGDDQEIKAKAGMPLLPGDQITTEKASIVWFSLNHAGIFKLNEEAQLSMDELANSDQDENHPVLRLILGYLWSKLKSAIPNKPIKMTLHTPTAIIGVRGTEFDTAAALDAATMVVVDQGRVEVEGENGKVTLTPGEMTRVDLDTQPSAPAAALPRDKRNWDEWLNNKMAQLRENLPQTAPKFSKRFVFLTDRVTELAQEVSKSSEQVAEAIAKVRRALTEGNRKKVNQAAMSLREPAQNFRETAARFRWRLNRARVFSKLSNRLETFVIKNAGKFSKEQFAVIDAHLVLISQKRMEMKNVSRQAIYNMRRTFKELQEVRRDIKAFRQSQRGGN
ncbi:MAG: FecR domain-containing protein [Deltaproteobacteria bacterium]|nr:FecR domain-containing protein [Deltaproteobacteria bacterium]